MDKALPKNCVMAFRLFKKLKRSWSSCATTCCTTRIHLCKNQTDPDVEKGKNFLVEKGGDTLHKIVPTYLDIVGGTCFESRTYDMKDWLEIIDGYLKMSWQDILTTRGRISMNTNNSRIRLEELKELYDIGKKVSLITENKRATTLRTAEAEKIVEKALLHCNSIIKLFFH